ncbi:MAG: sensor domain-containing diguanylate cyclase [Ruminococcus sp.]|nr:sensor domain-containing diguanylate cyclase [Ruminococcus sp.]
MTHQERNTPSIQNIKRLKISMIIGYTLIIIAAIISVSVLAVKKTDTTLKDKVSSMTTSLNVQMKINIDNYLSRMETIGTLAFAAQEAYTYDATNPENDEYEALNTEKIISDKLYSLCIMENFVDYGIVYRNNHTVGKISNGTSALFGTNLFNDLNAMINRKRSNDGWSAGYNGDFRRIYYVKKIHENALLVISFYATELESVFDNPENLSDMNIRLTDSNYNIIYSSVNNEVGELLPYEIMNRIDYNSATFMDSQYLITSNVCNEQWYVICSIPTSIIIKEKNEMQYYIIMTAFIAALLSTLFSIWLSIRLTDNVQRVVANLNTKAHIDQLTGILNKISFEEFTQNRLNNSLPIENHALILIDLDNFKGVNDTLGHAYGDEVLAKVGSILRGTFSTEDFLGRIGGDEFCVLINSYSDFYPSYKDFVAAKCEELCIAFRNNYTGDDGKYKISASIGAAMFPNDGVSFEMLYSCADKALYNSKSKGKDTYTFFEWEAEKNE